MSCEMGRRDCSCRLQIQLQWRRRSVEYSTIAACTIASSTPRSMTCANVSPGHGSSQNRQRPGDRMIDPPMIDLPPSQALQGPGRSRSINDRTPLRIRRPRTDRPTTPVGVDRHRHLSPAHRRGFAFAALGIARFPRRSGPADRLHHRRLRRLCSAWPWSSPPCALRGGAAHTAGSIWIPSSHRDFCLGHSSPPPAGRGRALQSGRSLGHGHLDRRRGCLDGLVNPDLVYEFQPRSNLAGDAAAPLGLGGSVAEI